MVVVIQFKSLRKHFEKERDGRKCNIVKAMTTDDKFKVLYAARNSPKDIVVRICDSENTSRCIKREVSDITFWEDLVIISWKYKEE